MESYNGISVTYVRANEINDVFYVLGNGNAQFVYRLRGLDTEASVLADFTDVPSLSESKEILKQAGKDPDTLVKNAMGRLAHIQGKARWMQVLERNAISVILNIDEITHRYYVAINEYDANEFAERVGAQSIVHRSDGAFDILVLAKGSY
jgi:hypothetical protein